ncbi:MAG: hypothetical protein ABIK28_12145 [Planctomycetota bacterium]
MLKRTKDTVPSCFFTHAGFLVFALLFACAMECGAQEAWESRQVAEAKELYGFDQWPAGLIRDGLPLASLDFTGYQRTAIDFQPGLPVILRYSDESSPRFLVEVLVCDSAVEAREKLVVYLTYISSPGKVPAIADAGVAAGDVGFVGLAPAGAMAWIVYVRDNIYVRICNLNPRIEPQPPMSSLAERIDKIILEQPVPEIAGKISRPSVDLRCEDSSPHTAGEKIPLKLAVRDRAGDAAAVTWVIGGTGQGYVEDDEFGNPWFHSTKEGKIRLDCHVLGARGTIVSHSLDLTIAKAR